MNSYRMLTCLKCGYEFKSNKKSVQPRCNKCGSHDLIETKDLFRKDDFSKFKAESSQKIDEMIDVIKDLISGHNYLKSEIVNLKLELKKEKSYLITDAQTQNTKEIISNRLSNIR